MYERPRFIADTMLGSLAKWLRLLGFDTLYFKKGDDSELVRIARQEGRILLTRDTGIARRKGTGALILLQANTTREQVREVVRALSSPGFLQGLQGATSRCMRCNGVLFAAGREEVADAVPEHIFLSYASFLKCGSCGKVYWGGSHWKHIDARIREIMGEIAGHWKTSGKD
ncbi:MAG: Mut7-C RNAse domain-containing protein [Alphaproteobacteria bacterium]|uniref:Mut7-C RNAse domain-containing protein n=1 Tax=Candidatus Nitrobium versatile TaxID=2884831 RepID=A0A953J728_9BACT|nr:Mut7-C RNAse domain-containing protein [Candidatus Nitrobium versatile]